jgi:hypothetical protein
LTRATPTNARWIAPCLNWEIKARQAFDVRLQQTLCIILPNLLTGHWKNDCVSTLGEKPLLRLDHYLLIYAEGMKTTYSLYIVLFPGRSIAVTTSRTLAVLAGNSIQRMETVDCTKARYLTTTTRYSVAEVDVEVMS